MNNILLCGFMGCGKTTVGQLLAERLAWRYVDLDDEIERIAGASIPELFSQYGEAHFRDIEHKALQSLAGLSGLMIATGGGTVTYLRNVQTFGADDLCVFLDAPFSVCWGRIYGSDRPLVRSHSSQELHTLFQERQKAYRAAAHVVVDAAAPPDQIAKTILLLLPNL